jgi:hypothetical protein
MMASSAKQNLVVRHCYRTRLRLQIWVTRTLSLMHMNIKPSTAKIPQPWNSTLTSMGSRLNRYQHTIFRPLFLRIRPVHRVRQLLTLRRFRHHSIFTSLDHGPSSLIEPPPIDTSSLSEPFSDFSETSPDSVLITKVIPPTPAPSQPRHVSPKISGRVSNKTRALLDDGLKKLEALLVEVSDDTRLPVSRILACLNKSNDRVMVNNSWNNYSKYFSQNTQEEISRVYKDEPPRKSASNRN